MLELTPSSSLHPDILPCQDFKARPRLPIAHTPKHSLFDLTNPHTKLQKIASVYLAANKMNYQAEVLLLAHNRILHIASTSLKANILNLKVLMNHSAVFRPKHLSL